VYFRISVDVELDIRQLNILSTADYKRIANMVYCRTIDELIKEEKSTLNKLISENRYGEVKDSIEIIEGLRELRVQKCK
jgi:hypothetical protein